MAISHTAMANDVEFAVVGAMSGPIAQWGDMEFNRRASAIKDINAKGGIKGDKLSSVEYDDACDPKQAVAVANKIVNDGIKYVIGHISLYPTCIRYLRRRRYLIISPGATDPELSPTRLSTHYAYCRAATLQGPTAAKYILETVKPQHRHHAATNNSMAKAGAFGAGRAKAANANVVFFDGTTAGEKDFSTLIAT
ncbi:ABC transporter substrate-binding protein [Escherichia coli]